MTAPSISYEDDDFGVRTIRINRPEARNALNLETKNLLVDALCQARTDNAVVAVVLTGANGVFVAGTDIKELAELSPTDHLIHDTGRVFNAVDEMNKPMIAAVEGYALGGGCELAMACDLVIAGQSAKFGQPEIRVGLIPGAGGMSRLVKRAGRARALYLGLTGDLIDAAEARVDGLVSKVCADGEAEAVAIGLARSIAVKPQINVRAIRKIARTAESAPLSTSIDLERSMFQTIFDTVDHAEGLAAFLEKRDPSYQGK